MTEATKQKWKRAAPHTAWGAAMAIVIVLQQAGVIDALAGRIRTDSADIIAEAVTKADEHTRSMITEKTAPIVDELKKLTREVDRMAGAMEESNRKRQ